ncbi:MAG: GntR family transcriptional regulator [Alphaproteobacteria bacterium]
MGGNPGISLTEQAYTQIEELIVTLQLPPGGAVSEGELCARTGFGRTPVREALQRLARQGLINILPRRGMFVTGIDVETQLQLLDLRREVERLMARHAARRASADERSRFRSLADAMDRAARDGDDEGFMALDQAFNNLVGTACRNPFARASMEQWNPLARRFWFQHHRNVGDLPRMASLHAAVARAVADGDADTAARASDELMDHLAGFTRAALDAGR